MCSRATKQELQQIQPMTDEIFPLVQILSSSFFLYPFSILAQQGCPIVPEPIDNVFGMNRDLVQDASGMQGMYVCVNVKLNQALTTMLLL